MANPGPISFLHSKPTSRSTHQIWWLHFAWWHIFGNPISQGCGGSPYQNHIWISGGSALWSPISFCSDWSLQSGFIFCKIGSLTLVWLSSVGLFDGWALLLSILSRCPWAHHCIGPIWSSIQLSLKVRGRQFWWLIGSIIIFWWATHLFFRFSRHRRWGLGWAIPSIGCSCWGLKPWVNCHTFRTCCNVRWIIWWGQGRLRRHSQSSQIHRFPQLLADRQIAHLDPLRFSSDFSWECKCLRFSSILLRLWPWFCILWVIFNGHAAIRTVFWQPGDTNFWITPVWRTL